MSNPDYLALRQLADSPGTPVPLRTLPLFRSLHAELRSFDPHSGRLEMAFTTTPEHVQGFGVVAGGVIGMMLDFALSLPVLGMLPPDTPFGTIGYSVNLLAALRPGPVLAHGSIERLGSRIAFTTARLVSETSDRAAVATATGTISIGAARPAPAKEQK